MSFYGNLYLEFQEFFYNFLFKGNKDGTDFPEKEEDILNGDLEIQPKSTFDTLTFNTGNRWIQAVKNSSEDANLGENVYDGITLYHAPAGGGDEEVTAGFELLSESELSKLPESERKKIPTLSSGSYFKTAAPTFDAAGHLVTFQDIKYQLPKLNLTVGDKKATTFQIQGIQIEDDKNILELGTKFKVPVINYDQADDTLSITLKDFQMPEIDIDGDISNLEDTVTKLRANIGKTLGIDYLNGETKVQSGLFLEDYFSKNIETETFTKITNFANAIGHIKYYSDYMDSNFGEKGSNLYNLEQVVIRFTDEIMEDRKDISGLKNNLTLVGLLSDQINDKDTGLAVLADKINNTENGLLKRVQSLEEKVENLINPPPQDGGSGEGSEQTQ